ncbi:hypothetical protein ANN_06545, partial [Periplaneta americana]
RKVCNLIDLRQRIIQAVELITPDMLVKTWREVEYQVQCHGIQASMIWFQQDEATAHTARLSMAMVRGLFPGHVVSRGSDVLDLPTLQTCLYVITFFGVISKRKCLLTSHATFRN